MGRSAEKKMARKADVHALYERAVQCVEADIDFATKTFRKFRSRALRSLREDFCGTFSAAVEFVRRNQKNNAIAIDLDPQVLAYGREKHLPKLKGASKRLQIHRDDVVECKVPPVDAILAMNFSYFCFKERDALIRYFKAAHRGLHADGLLYLDVYGGWESWEPMEEEKDFGDFVYVWDQSAVDPINNHVVNYIHFRFPDGSKIEQAYTYNWRLWTLPEIRECLTAAGFKESHVYWEGWDEKNSEGDGVFKRTHAEENCAGWIAYVVASK